MTGTGFYNINSDRFGLEVSVSDPWQCDLKYVRTGERIRVTGKCNGDLINREATANDDRQHKSPELERQKDNH